VHVGILTYDFEPFIGGQGRVTRALYDALLERHDIDVTVISPAHAQLARHRSRFTFTQRYGRHPLFSLLATARVNAWCSAFGIDLLHVNGGPGGVLLLRPPAVPAVYHIFHTYAQTARLMPGHRWKRSFEMLERVAYRHADAIVGSTPSSVASVRDDLGLRTRAEVIPCGIDVAEFPQRRVAREPATIFFVGRLDHRKNPELLLRAFALVRGSHPDARLVIAGKGILEPRLRACAEELGIGEAVRFEGFIEHDALIDWYNRATVVAVPSHFEGFGLSAAEAQACGACVVVSDTAGLRDVVEDGVTGARCALDPGAFASRIGALLDDPAERARLGTEAAARIRSANAWPAITERFLCVYRDVLEGERSEKRPAIAPSERMSA
jgi:glycosyltransferase involved in cell wall biosynthesis